MRRTASILFVLGLLLTSVGSALAHEQSLSDGQDDAVDFSKVDSDADGKGSTATPLDLKSGKFSETSQKFTFRIGMHSKVTPDELCDDGCSPGSLENEGIITVQFYKGSDADPKNLYFVAIFSDQHEEYVAGLYRFTSGGEIQRVGGFEGSVLNEGGTFVLKITRSRLTGYGKGTTMKWQAITEYITSANDDKCVPNEGQPFYGACVDSAPNGTGAKHRLRS